MKKIAVVVAALALCACSKPAAEAPAKSSDTVAVKDTAPASQPAAKAAAPAKGSTPDDRDQVDADGVVRRGSSLDGKQAALTVSTCMKDAEKYDKKSVKIEGTVDQVCAKKGCWWMLSGDKPEEQIRITAKDYGFFVPKDAKGKRAVVEGMFEVKKLSDEEAQHLADDSGDPNAKPVKQELRLVAVGLEMHQASKAN